MKTRRTITISLPPEMADQVERTMRDEHRTRSELVREALRTYIAIRQLPEEVPTAAELRALRRGRAAYRRGEYVALDALRQADYVDRSHHRARAKISPPASRA